MRPSILVVVSTFPRRSETSVVDHIRGLQHHGWRVHVVCLALDTDLLREHRELATLLRSVHVLGRDAARPRRAFKRVMLAMSSRLRPADLRRSPVLRRGAYLAPRVAEAIDAARPDVVYAHWAPNAVAAALATTRSQVPVIADLHGYDLTRVPRVEGWHAYRTSLADCALVVHSEFGRALVRDHLGRDPILCPFGIDSVFAPPERADTWPHPLRVLTVGRLVAEKGHDTALAALAQLRRRRPDVDARLTIVGAGPADDALRRSARALGLGGAVDFLGELSRAAVARQMRESDILVVASRAAPDGWMEVFGRVAAEGLCSGMAVIVTAHGGLPEVVGDAGMIVCREGPMAVTEAIETLVDHECPIDIAANARRRAAAFSLEENWAMDDRIARRFAGRGDEAVGMHAAGAGS